MREDNVVVAKSVYKDFKLPHESSKSLKGVFTSVLRSGSGGRETQHALRNISFEVKRGEFFGIVGRNGGGKSTLLKLLAGIYQPTKGSVTIQGKLVPFIELGVGFNPELTGKENVYLNGALLGFSRPEVVAMYDDIVQFAELERFMDQKLKNYSSGMQVRLAFSLAIRAQADVLLIDEVLAVGDASFQRKCFEYFKKLKANKKTVIFVTHDMNAVREYCDRAMLINDTRVEAIGSPQAIAQKYAQLFIDEEEQQPDEEEAPTDEPDKKNGSERWGTGKAKIRDVVVSCDAKELIVRYNVKAAQAISGMLYGLHVIAPDGSEVTAMNNRMLQLGDIRDLQAGDQVGIEWKIMNVFNDGKYKVTLTLADDLTNTLDWYNRAGTFTVRRAERSTTAVLPPVTVTTTIDK